ncbi:MAG: riboflavin biosynthesis protein RibBA [Myxococcales bacterium]
MSNSIEAGLQAIGRGELVVLIDDHGERREQGASIEGDLVVAAEHVTPDIVNFMATHARGLVCVAMTPERVERFGLALMPRRNSASRRAWYTVSVEAREGVSTGISAADRARTIEVLADDDAGPDDLVSPGHVFPMRSWKGGSLARPGDAEAAVDLARYAGCRPVAALCQVLTADGAAAGPQELERFAEEHGLQVVRISELVRWRMEREIFVECVQEAPVETEHGPFVLRVYQNKLDGRYHPVMTRGDLQGQAKVLVRIHSQCLTGDVFHSLRCDCGEQLDSAMSAIAERGVGALIYLRQEGRGIGLVNKLKAYGIQDRGKDTVEANLELGFVPDLREYVVGAQILSHLGVESVCVITNNPRKIDGLGQFGVKVAGRVPIEMEANATNRHYLATKKAKLGHLLEHV